MQVDDEQTPSHPPRPPLPDPTATGRMGLRLFLLSLSVLFLAGIAALVLSRLSRPTDGLSAVVVPDILWLSTLLLLVSGIAVEAAAQYARRARLPETGRWLRWSLLASVLFVAAQVVGMLDLLSVHQLSLTTRALIGLDGMAFVLVLLHAIHVLGGMILLTILAGRAVTGRLSLQHMPSVRSAATYWHFLEFVWLLMLLALHLTG